MVLNFYSFIVSVRSILVLWQARYQHQGIEEVESKYPGILASMPGILKSNREVLCLNKNRPALALLLGIMLLALMGCALTGTGDHPAEPEPLADEFQLENQALARLLPERENYTWIYSGFVEYGHRMNLDSISEADSNIVYNITGQVDDPSDGEAQHRNFNLQVTYLIENGVLTQIKRESAMLDSKFDNLELVRYPLEVGTTWEQQVVSPEGNAATLECTIESIRVDNGKNVYTIMYKEQGTDYFEKREIKEGTGILLFEKLLELDDLSFPAGYYLYEEMSGYQE